MATGQQIQKKEQANSTVTPKTELMRSRPFAEPAQPQSLSTLEVQTKVESGQTTLNLSRLDLSASPPIQPKLTIGAPADKYEQEADAIARQVVTQMSYPTHDNSTGESVQRQTIFQPSISRLTVQRQEAIGGGTASLELESTISRAKGGGTPLAEPIRRQMEGAFGSDFSGVRVHTNSTADTLNRSLSARAFTTGNNIFFKQGEYNPSSSSGKELLAHELTHVVQQGGANQIVPTGGNLVKRKSQLNPATLQKQAQNQTSIQTLATSHAPIVQPKAKGTIQRGFLGSVWNGVKKVGGAIATGVKTVGEVIATGANAVSSAVKKCLSLARF